MSSIDLSFRYHESRMSDKNQPENNDQVICVGPKYSDPTTDKQLLINESEQNPRSYLWWSILNAICCSFLFGSVALFFSKQTLNEYSLGHYEKAQQNSRKSLLFNILATVLGTIFTVVLLYP